jgi:lipopolysaccharide biosynthesis protein
MKEDHGNKIRFIAFYLPQFHPIPENDYWWGRGFTEWTNVARAKPLFRNHYQPRLPADLGFYDLRLPESRIAQAELAQQYGIEGFCYWHYWFNGKRLLEKPFEEVLRTGKPEFPFCLAWANESWSRRWLGEEKKILLKQTYSTEDDLKHIRWLMEAFTDDRYLLVNNRPLFLIYRPCDLPDPIKTTDTFRNQCVKSGIPDPFLIGIDAHCRNFDCTEIGFDGTLKFEPQLGVLPDFMEDGFSFTKLMRNLKLDVYSPKLKIYDYAQARALMNREKPTFTYYPSVFVGWDNTPRRGSDAIIVINSDPDKFERALTEIVENVSKKDGDHRLVFINAWNEWAEGNYLEPDLINGDSYLEAIWRIHLG